MQPTLPPKHIERAGATAFQLSGYTLLYLAATGVSAVAAVFAFRIRRAPGGWWLFLLTVSATVWALADAFNYSALTLAAHVTSAQFAYFGSTAPVLFLLFSLQYSGRGRGPIGWSTAWLFVVPLIGIVAAFTNQYHHLLWPGVTVLAERPNMVVYQHGPVFWLVTLYSLGVALLATLLLVDTAMQSRGVYRSQCTVIAVAAVFPWAAGVAYSLAPKSLAGLEPSLTLTVTAGILVWAMWRLKLLDLVLVPREVIVEELTDGLIVLDGAARILEINPAAVRLLGLAKAPDLGTPAVDAFSASSKSGVEALSSVYEQRASTLLLSSGAVLSVERSRLEGGREGQARDMFILRDITAQIEAERARDAAHKDLQVRMAEIERLHEELRELAVRDPLTGLHNRRYLNEELERELARAVREDYPVSIVMFDVDFFKDVNDTLGHAAGDEILRAIADEMLSGSRRSDITCRYGGDEFIVVLPRVTGQQALERAEGWRLQLAECMSRACDGQVRPTVSLGVATFPQHGATIDDIIAAADRAVYASKSAGNDRVSLAATAPQQVGGDMDV